MNKFFILFLIFLGASLLAFLFKLKNLALVEIALSLVFLFLLTYRTFKSKEIKKTISIKPIIFILCFFSVVIGVKFFNVNIDLTPNNKFSLTKKERDLLSKIKSKIDIYLIRSNTNKNIIKTREVFEPFLKHSKNKFNIFDISKISHPNIFNKYGVTESDKALIISGEKSYIVKTKKRGELSLALLNLSDPELKTAYFITGHGEPKLNSLKASGYSSLVQNVKIAGVQIKELLLASSTSIPNDAEFLFALNSNSFFSEYEAKLLKGYLENGGKLIIFNEPSLSNNLNDILYDFGITLKNNYIYQNKNKVSTQDNTKFIVRINNSHEITRHFNNSDFFLVSNSGFIEYHSDSNERRKYTPLVNSLSSSYIDGGKAGVYTIGLAFSGFRFINKNEFNWSKQKHKKAKIVVFSDSDFIKNSYLSNFSHKKLIINALNWLQEKEIEKSQQENNRFIQLIDSSLFKTIMLFNIIVIQIALILACILFNKKN